MNPHNSLLELGPTGRSWVLKPQLEGVVLEKLPGPLVPSFTTHPIGLKERLVARQM